MGWRIRKVSKHDKKFTLGDILDAVIANGLPKERGTYWNRGIDWKYEDEEFTIGSACAIGQAALNLGVPYGVLDTVLGKISYRQGSQSLGHSIIRTNDGSNKSVPEIGEHYKRVYKNKLNLEYTLPVEYEIISKDA